ncbi:MAG: hypothetical protein GVY26_02840 [Bacteroidetes bacterium]|jgi:hypothetical protein|nr:hypothetical protein [Bacteroidota bacterium]
MKSTFPLFLLLLAWFLPTAASYAQTTFFEPVAEKSIRSVSTRLIEPLKTQTYQIDG